MTSSGIGASKVAIISTGLPFGGTTAFTLFLATGLKSLGIPIQILSLARVHSMQDEFEKQGIPVFSCNDDQLIYEEGMRQVLDKLRAFEPTTIISSLGHPAFEILRYAPPGVLRIGMLQDHQPGVYELAHTYRHLVDHFAAVSNTIRQEMASLLPETPCHFMPYGVFLEAGIHRSEPAADQPLRILYAGRLNQKQKQVQLFPKIWQALRNRGVPFQWTILGEGEEEAFLRHHLDEGVRAGEIIFAAPIFDRRELAETFAAHDIFLLCSAHEGLPLALLEAMGYGLIPICGDIPSLQSGVITPENGFLVPQDQPDTYAEIIAQLHHQRPRLESLSTQATSTIAHDYTTMAMTQRFVQLMAQYQSKQIDPWPSHFSIRPPLGMEKRWHMAPFLRPARRLFKRLKAARKATRQTD